MKERKNKIKYETKLIRLTILMILLLMFSTTVFAMGIAPARKTIEFHPNQEEIITYRIYNSDNQELTAKVTLEGVLSEVGMLSQDLIEFTSEEKVKEINLTISLGAEMPNLDEGRITVTGQIEETGVAARVQVSSKLTLKSVENTPEKVKNEIISTPEKVKDKIISTPEEPNIKLKITNPEETEQKTNKEVIKEMGKIKYVFGALIILLIIGNLFYLIPHRKEKKKNRRTEEKETIIER